MRLSAAIRLGATLGPQVFRTKPNRIRYWRLDWLSPFTRYSLYDVIVLLNDDLRWSRTRIADLIAAKGWDIEETPAPDRHEAAKDITIESQCCDCNRDRVVQARTAAAQGKA